MVVVSASGCNLHLVVLYVSDSLHRGAIRFSFSALYIHGGVCIGVRSSCSSIRGAFMVVFVSLNQGAACGSASFIESRVLEILGRPAAVVVCPRRLEGGTGKETADARIGQIAAVFISWR